MSFLCWIISVTELELNLKILPPLLYKFTSVLISQKENYKILALNVILTCRSFFKKNVLVWWIKLLWIKRNQVLFCEFQKFESSCVNFQFVFQNVVYFSFWVVCEFPTYVVIFETCVTIFFLFYFKSTRNSQNSAFDCLELSM